MRPRAAVGAASLVLMLIDIAVAVHVSSILRDGDCACYDRRALAAAGQVLYIALAATVAGIFLPGRWPKVAGHGATLAFLSGYRWVTSGAKAAGCECASSDRAGRWLVLSRVVTLLSAIAACLALNFCVE